MAKENPSSTESGETKANKFTVKKLNSFFVDEVSNISIAPNGACRLQFVTWGSDEEGQPQRVDSEIILTIHTLKTLSEALPNAIQQADKAMTKRQVQPRIKKTVQ